MRLQQASVSNFRCIDDSQKFTLAPVTCLVGKNESGKTAVLLALERLNPHDSTRGIYNKLLDYPRKRLADYDELHPQRDAEVLDTYWILDPPEIAEVEKQFGPGAMKAHCVSIRKGYDNVLTWIGNFDEHNIAKHLVTSASLTDEERTAIGDVNDLQALTGRVEAIEAKGSGLSALQQKVMSLLSTGLDKAVSAILTPFLPKFLYFASYDRMNGNVHLDTFANQAQQNTLSPNDKVFRAFLDFAGVKLDDLRNAQKYEELKARVEAASIKISQQIFQYWSQNKNLKVEFSVDSGRPSDTPPFNGGWIMRTRILNRVHEMTVSFDERSAGFVWFFSFLVMFSQVKKSHGNVIILLDEPGLNLHAKAQSDLLRFIREKLSSHQVIYSTHSPFMVPVDDLSSVRTVEDVVRYSDGDIISEGTKVGDEVLSTDRDTVFPLQGALGYEITQSLFIGEHTLLVEGPSDLLFLQAFSDALKSRQGRVHLDKRWTICPTGGIDKVPAFLSLFGGNKLHVAVLTDVAKGSKNKLEQVRRSKILKDNHLLTVAEFSGQSEADIEDVIGAALYADLVNGAFDVPADQRLTSDSIRANSGNAERLLEGVETIFRTMPTAVPEFDHYRAASWLAANRQVLDSNDGHVVTALERFENLFRSLNSLL